MKIVDVPVNGVNFDVYQHSLEIVPGAAWRPSYLALLDGAMSNFLGHYLIALEAAWRPFYLVPPDDAPLTAK